MDAEKKHLKGRFLYLFDWHAKPRKKLFSNKSQSSAGSNEWKENLDHSTATEFLSREPRFGEDGYITKGSGNNTSTSSVNGDDVYGTRAPGVVARLMGLESLPTSGEASSVSSHDYESAVGSSYYPRNGSNHQRDHHTVDYSYMANRLDGYNSSSIDSTLNTVRGRPIERFQTEVLPPKSSKPISITHHKLLSPIKSPGFVHKNDAAYIMEAAARIIDSAPQASLTRTPSFGSASSPLRIRDIRDKLEAAHRSNILVESSQKSKQSPSIKSLRGNLRNKLLVTPLSRSKTSDPEASGSRNTIRKGKGVSPAVRENENLQRKDGTASSSRKSLRQKEHKKAKTEQSFNSQPTAKKSRQTTNSANKSPEVLRVNSEKQNYTSNKDKANSMSSIPNQQLKRSVQTDGTVGSSKTLNKFMLTSENGSKKVISTAVTRKQPSLNRINNISRSKEQVVKDKQVEGAYADTLLAKSLQDDFAIQAGTDNKEVMDVISFTFNSSLENSVCMSQSSNEMTRSNGLVDYESYDINDQSNSKNASSPVLRLKLTDADTLSLILGQKLKELTNKVESTESESQSTMNGSDACSIPTWSELGSKTNAVRANFIEHEDWHKYNPDFAYKEPKKREEIEGECSIIKTSKFITRDELDGGHLDILAPECSVSYGGCISSNSRSDCIYGNAESLSCQSEEEISCASTEKFYPVEDERDISDTASSSYYEEWDGKHTSTSHSVSEYYLNFWELQYVRQILHCGMWKEFVLDANTNFIDASVFDLLEMLMINSTTNTEECTKLARKLLFDCVNDFLSLRYEQVSYGSYKAWSRWRLLLQKEDWLVEELFKEILGLENLGNLVVDELVEKDMGIQFRGWLDFEIEMLEEGMDIEWDIVDSLIDELVFDISYS